MLASGGPDEITFVTGMIEMVVSLSVFGQSVPSSRSFSQIVFPSPTRAAVSQLVNIHPLDLAPPWHQ